MENELLLYALLFLGFFVALGAVVAYQARQRGYGFLAWLVAATLGNPVFSLLLLGILPDRAKRRLRERELADVRGRMRPAARRVAGPSAAVQRSIGDVETARPADRSIGDDVTRG